MEFDRKFKEYLEEAIGQQNADIAFSAFEAPASVSVRRNPSKVPAVFPYVGEAVPWSAEGLLLKDRPAFTLDPLFHGGAYYVQDSSSMFVGHAFRKVLEKYCEELPADRPLRVLDLCAAPGGKTTDLAASLRAFCGDRFLLVANEVMKQRVAVLADNVALWGDPNVLVTSDDPSAFAQLEGYFDIILTDVPCSGEGMFRKDEEAVAQWSADTVALCEARQRRILADVWPALHQDGFLIYSTCTFNRHENDGNVAWIRDELGADCLGDFLGDCSGDGIIGTEYGYSLVPGFVPGEGQYCAALRKTAAAPQLNFKRKGKKAAAMKDFAELFNRPVGFSVKGDLLIAFPAELAADAAPVLELLYAVLSGCAAGTLKGRLLVPGADLALSTLCNREVMASVEVSRETALAFLHRDAIVLPDAPKGYVLLTYQGVALGFVKNLGNRCNNLHPQSRRIRMDIK